MRQPVRWHGVYAVARGDGLLTNDALREIVAAAFGTPDGLALAVRLSGGSINTTYALRRMDGSSAILRVAPSDATAGTGPSWLTPWGLRREAAVIALLPDLHRLLPVTIAHDFRRAVIDRDWVIQDVMPGALLSDLDATLPADERTALWAELGAITRRLHAVRGEAFGPPVHGQRFDRWSDLLLHDAGQLIEDAGRFALSTSPFDRLRRLTGELATVLDDGVTPRLVHSDLAPSHVFVDRTAEGMFRIAGIIDLEFGRFADPQMERLITTLCWGDPLASIASSFFRGYGRDFASPEDRIRLRIYVAIALGWSATILAWRDQGEDLPGVMRQLDDVLNGLERILP